MFIKKQQRKKKKTSSYRRGREHQHQHNDKVIKIMDMINSLDVIDLRSDSWNFVREYSPYENKQINFTRHLAKLLMNLSEKAKKVLIDPHSITKMYHLIQWVESVIDVSSEYSTGKGRWGVVNLIGQPQNQTIYKSCRTAWSPLWINGLTTQHLIIQFKEEVFICGVDIFESWNAGCILCLSAYYQEQWTILWSTEVSNQNLSSFRVFSPCFDCTPFKSNIIRIDFDTSDQHHLPEIEAIRLRGRESYYWTPDTHIRYPMVFSQTTKCLLICIKHFEGLSNIRIPRDLKYLIIQYLAIRCEKWTNEKEEEEEIF